MATDSPMSNFNRKNPYVIQAKRQYNILMDKYVDIAKLLIITNIWVLAFIMMNIIYDVIHFSIIKSITGLIIVCIYIGIVIHFIRNTIKDDINTDIDEMVTMESNEIMNIDITYVQQLLYKIHNCIGKVDAYVHWYKIIATLVCALLFITIWY